MTALLIDDDPEARGVLRQLLERFCPHVQICDEADSVTTGLSAIQQHRPNVVFLDVDLQGQSSFAILDAYPRPDFKVVFVTAHDDFALRAFRYRAFHYLLKPIDPKDLIAVTNELAAPNGTNGAHNASGITAANSVRFPSVQSTMIVQAEEIICFLANEGYTTVVLESGEHLFSGYSLREMQDTLPPDQFVRPHQSYIVRLGAVRKINKGQTVTLVLRDKTAVPVSRRSREEVLRLLGG